MSEAQTDNATPGNDGGEQGKQIVGYPERWAVRAGQRVSLHASSHSPGPATVDLVRISCGDPTRYGPGFLEHAVEGSARSVHLDTQLLEPGSFATFNLGAADAADCGRIELSLNVLATRPQLNGTVATVETTDSALRVVVRDRHLHAEVDADGTTTSYRISPRPVANRRWYRLTLSLDGPTRQFESTIVTTASASPARDLGEPLAPWQTNGSIPGSSATWGDARRLTIAESGGRGDFDGRIGGLRLALDGVELTWDASLNPETRSWTNTSGHDLHGLLHQLPTRGITGMDWDGSEQRWSDAPEQWDAVHFHTDDLYDANWPETVEVEVPADAPSGIYAIRVRDEVGNEDRVPLFVRPAAGSTPNDVAFLMSSATYLAYANHRMLFDGADFIVGRTRLRPEHEYVRAHPELGRSMYERHPDGSGVMFSSRNRPVLNLRPGADGWNFTPDTDINAFLEHTFGDELGRPGHDIISDEDLHQEGLDAIEPYRVLVTCTHPEYWSTPMLDALAAWQRSGGRLVYLGGNGFYWRVAFSDHWPGAMELRRAEDGVRNWRPDCGEYFHAWEPDPDTGRAQLGGMWRRLGRSPNEVAGIGFAAQGFENATSYEINGSSLDTAHPDGRMAWAWDGVVPDEGRIGTSGLGGGAAGQEIDRYDTRLGSPAHAVVLASATDFAPDMLRTKEEFEGSVAFPSPDPFVRSDVVIFETPGGGAAFSVGSISWFGALARNGYDNDIARLTANVLRRFADPAPFDPPPESIDPSTARGLYS